MTVQAIIGLIALVAPAAFMIAIMRFIAGWAKVARIALAETAMEILDDPSTNQQKRQLLNRLMDDAFSFSAGWKVAAAAIRGLRREILGKKLVPSAEVVEMMSDRRCLRATHYFILSVIAANPIAGAMALVAAIFGSAIRRRRLRRTETARFLDHAVAGNMHLA